MYKNNRDMFSTFTETFRRVLDKHAPLKTKRVRGNLSPFKTKELSQAVMNKLKPRNKYVKWTSRENFLALKRAKNYCNNLTRTEAITQRCSLEKVFWKYAANLQENVHAEVRFYWNCTSAWVFSCKFAAYFQNTFS